jgi:hypothetical protein
LTWTKVEVPKPHYCGIPSLASLHPELDYGDIISCDQCGQHWKLTGKDSGMQWDPYQTRLEWTKIDAPGTGWIQGR